MRKYIFLPKSFALHPFHWAPCKRLSWSTGLPFVGNAFLSFFQKNIFNNLLVRSIRLSPHTKRCVCDLSASDLQIELELDSFIPAYVRFQLKLQQAGKPNRHTTVYGRRLAPRSGNPKSSKTAFKNRFLERRTNLFINSEFAYEQSKSGFSNSMLKSHRSHF